MRQLITIVMIIVLMNSSDSRFLNHSTCSDGSPAPYHITQPSTNDHVQIVSPDALRLTLMCSLNITIPSGMTITWLHDDQVKFRITTQVDQTSNAASLLRGKPGQSDAGVYQCVFNNSNGCTLSTNITLLILDHQSLTNTSSPTPPSTVTAVINLATVNFQSLTRSANHSVTTATDTLMTNDITTTSTTSTVDLNVMATMAHTIVQSANHSASSFTTNINTLITTDVTTIATKSTDFNVTAITNSANTITMFTNSPTLSTLQSNDRSVYSSVGALVVIAVVLLVVFVIIAVIVVGIIVVCYKRKRSKQCTKQEDADSSSSIDEKLSQRPPTSIPEPIKVGGQDKKDPNTKGLQTDKEIMEDHYYSIPFKNQVAIQYEQVNMQVNPAYFLVSGMNTSTEVHYYNVATTHYKNIT